MKLIINTSNLHGGGGTQVGFSFIHECIKFPENEYSVFLCPQLSNEIDLKKFPSNFDFYNFPNPPSPSINGLSVIKKLAELEKQINPDCVFSIFGPTYWTPKSKHLMGFANGHFLYSEFDFFKRLSIIERVQWRILSIAKRFFFLKNANYYHVETEDARSRLAKYLSCSLDSIYTVSNTYNSVYNSTIPELAKILPLRTEDEFRLVCISAYYSHKNLEILNKVIPLLFENGFSNIKFVLTIDQNIYTSKFSELAKQQIMNIGPILIDNCPQLYSECDAMFLPTLLECFSANYPEAMKMRKPILTSNLSFAIDVCADAALYFNPLDERDIFKTIINIFNNKPLHNELILRGIKRLKSFNSAEERALKYIEICKHIVTVI